jgi:hypothetical protein
LTIFCATKTENAQATVAAFMLETLTSIPFLNVRAAENHSGKTLLVNEILMKIGGRRI